MQNEGERGGVHGRFSGPGHPIAQQQAAKLQQVVSMDLLRGTSIVHKARGWGGVGWGGHYQCFLKEVFSDPSPDWSKSK